MVTEKKKFCHSNVRNFHNFFKKIFMNKSTCIVFAASRKASSDTNLDSLFVRYSCVVYARKNLDKCLDGCLNFP